LFISDEQIAEMARGIGVVGDAMFAQWSDGVLTDERPGDLVGFVRSRMRGIELILRLASKEVLTLPVRVGLPLPPKEGEQAPQAWGLDCVGPHTWRLTPSIVSNATHAVVTLVGVPEPAPFEVG